MTDTHTSQPTGSFNSGLLREIPTLMRILLADKTTRRNIIWATDSYADRGNGFAPEDTIHQRMVTNENKTLIQPRVLKVLAEQKARTKKKAEVYTPNWVVKEQNDLIEKEFEGLPLDEYIQKMWLELTCGEGPYMCSPYDASDGTPIPLSDRIGFVDRKLQRISQEVDTHDDWLDKVYTAYKASYGYEFQGDSLLLARENLLYTFIDYYTDKFRTIPNLSEIETVAKIISWNVFQMDGLKYIIPLSNGVTYIQPETKQDIFGFDLPTPAPIAVPQDGIKVRIKDWHTNKILAFEDLLHAEGEDENEV